MVKKLFLIVVLLIAILAGVIYLRADGEKAISFSVDSDIKPIIILSDDYFMINEGDSFYPENFISIYHPNSCVLAVDKSFDTEKIGSYNIDILVSCGDGEASAVMTLEVVAKEVEIVTVEKVVTEYIAVSNNDNTETAKTEEKIEESPSTTIDEDTTSYFYGYHDINLPSGSSVSELIKALSSDIVTNVQVTIDYAEVDLSYKGTYKAYYYTELGTFSVLVTIY